MAFLSDNEIDALLAASFRESILELYIEPYETEETTHLTRFLSQPWPRLQTLRFGGPEPLWAEFAKTKQLPNLCTLQVGWPPLEEAQIQQLAANPHMPHLSLILNNSFDKPQWLVREGRAFLVDNGVELFDRNLWEQGHYTV
jgi:hypothetical protein